MATATRKKISNIIFGFVLVTLLGCCSAKVYKVGDSDGWSPKGDTYNDWVKGKDFFVGDSLVFEYDRNLNDVTQVSGALEYMFCDPSSPKAVYNTGHDVVTFTEPGEYYFISSNQAQCELGQKLDILVVHDPSRPVPPPPPSNNLPLGKTYKVGDYKGWSVYDGDYYFKWSEEKQFQVGDKLLFEYGNEDNDVWEISGDLEFMSCDPISPVAMHNTGYDLVTLTKPGVHYFISTKPGHCAAGLKLRVVVGPLTEAVAFPNFPKTKTDLSHNELFNRWSSTFYKPITKH